MDFLHEGQSSDSSLKQLLWMLAPQSSVSMTLLGRGHTILMSCELMWCYVCSWDVRGDLTLNSMVQIHTSVTLLTSRDLTWSSGRSRASTPLTFLLSHTFRETWPKCRVLFRRYQLFAEKHTVYVGGYPETDTTGMLSPPTAWRQKLTR